MVTLAQAKAQNIKAGHGTRLFVNNIEQQFMSVELTDQIHEANTLSFTSNKYFNVSINPKVFLVGPHKSFGGYIQKMNETWNGLYQYDCIDFTRRLHGKKSYTAKKKRGSDIIKKILSGTGISTGGIQKSSKIHSKLTWKNMSVEDICHQVASKETGKEFFLNEDGVAIFRSTPLQLSGYFIDAGDYTDFTSKADTSSVITGVTVLGEKGKSLYKYTNKTLKARFGDLQEILESSDVKSKSTAKTLGTREMQQKKVELAATIKLPVLENLAAGQWIMFSPPSYVADPTKKKMYIQSVKTSIDGKKYEQSVDLLTAQPVWPDNWMYDNLASTGVVATTAAQKKAESLGSWVGVCNWVRKNVKYQFYYNSRYTVAQTYSKRKGNCTDQSNLLIHMLKVYPVRATRQHTTCKGIGHYNVKVVANGKSYIADPTCSSRNKVF